MERPIPFISSGLFSDILVCGIHSPTGLPCLASVGEDVPNLAETLCTRIGGNPRGPHLFREVDYLSKFFFKKKIYDHNRSTESAQTQKPHITPKVPVKLTSFIRLS